MLSRVAENIYWLARYVERAENTARLINVNTNLMLDLPKLAKPGWEPIIEILGANEHFHATHEDVEERSVLRYLISETNNPVSILNSLSLARENSRTIRDILPREAWERLNDVYIFTREQAQKGISKRGRYEYLQKVISGAQTLTGLLAGTMLHDEGYDFLRMGRNLERADMTTRIIDVRTASLLENAHEELTPFENIQWMSVLKSLTAYQMYRRTVQVRIRRADVLMFLLQERRFPRAFYHAVCEVEGCLRNLPRNAAAIDQINKLQRKVLQVDPADLEQDDLHEFIDDLQLGLAQVNSSIDQTYFLHSE
jgi:uncharacterized alpha-E superfamily protein